MNRPPSLTQLPRNVLQAVFNRLNNKSAMRLRAAGNKHTLGQMSGLKSRMNHTSVSQNALSRAIHAVPFDPDAQPRILRLLATGTRVQSKHIDEFVHAAYPHLPKKDFAKMLRVLMNTNGAKPTPEATVGFFSLADVTYLHSLGLPLGGEGLVMAWDIVCSPQCTADYKAAFEYRLINENARFNFWYLVDVLHDLYFRPWSWATEKARFACLIAALVPAFHTVSDKMKQFAAKIICQLVALCHGSTIDVTDAAAISVLDTFKQLTWHTHVATDVLNHMLAPSLVGMSDSKGTCHFYFALLDTLARNGAHVGLTPDNMDHWIHGDAKARLTSVANWLLDHCESKDRDSLRPILRFMDPKGIHDRMKRGWLLMNTWSTWSSHRPSCTHLDDLDAARPAFPGAGTDAKVEFFKNVWEDVCWCSQHGQNVARVLDALNALTTRDTRACTQVLGYVLDAHQAVRIMNEPEFFLALLDILKRNGGNVVVSPELVEGWTAIIHKSGGHTRPVSLKPFEMRPFEFLRIIGQWMKRHVSPSNQKRLQNALDPSIGNKDARAWSQKIARAVPRIAKSINSQNAKEAKEANARANAWSKKIARAVPRIAKSINSDARYQRRVAALTNP